MIRNKFKHLQLTDVLQVVVEEISFFIRMPSTCWLEKKLKVGGVRTRVGGTKKKRNFWKFTTDRVAGPSGGEDCHENLCYLIPKEEKEKKTVR